MAERKRGCLGCSFPLIIIIAVVAVGLVLVGLAAGPIGKELGINMPSWLGVHQPEIELAAPVVFHIFGFPVTNTILATWLTIIVLVLFAWAATRRMRIVPGRIQHVWETIVGLLYGFCQGVAGEKYARSFFPIVATIFLMVIANAWLSLLPIFGVSFHVTTAEGEVELLRSANTDINMPLAMAIISFVSVAVYGFKAHGSKYLEVFFNWRPIARALGQLFRGKIKSGFGGLVGGIINAFVGFIELISQLIRLLSLTLRLFGNMTAGEILLLIVVFMVPFLVVNIVYGLEILIGFVQAFIFSGLTLVYLTMAVAEHEPEHNK